MNEDDYYKNTKETIQRFIKANNYKLELFKNNILTGPKMKSGLYRYMNKSLEIYSALLANQLLDTYYKDGMDKDELMNIINKQAKSVIDDKQFNHNDMIYLIIDGLLDN